MLCQHLDGRCGNRLLRRVGNVERMSPAGNVHDRATVEKTRYGHRIDGRRHHDEPKIGSRLPGLPGQRDREVGVDAPFVEFVDDNGSEVREQGILLEASGQDALGRDQQPRRRLKAPLEPDVPADFSANRPPAFEGNPMRDGSRRDASGLEEDD